MNFKQYLKQLKIKEELKMRKVFNKVLAGITATTLVASLAIGVGVSSSVKAADTAVALSNWSFVQGGQYSPTEEGNEGYIGSVTMNGTGEKIDGWLTKGEESVNQEKSATKSATGFDMVINNNGWDCQWKVNTGFPTDRINPWSIQAINQTSMTPGHIYTVSFKAHADKKKHAYVAFGTETKDLAPYDQDPVEFANDASNQIITLGTKDKTFTFTFTNWVSASTLKTTLMLGAFDAQADFAGADVSNIITEVEKCWKGTVSVSDFTITDKGQNPDFIVEPPKPTQPTQPTKPSQPSQPAQPAQPAAKKLARVAKVKAKNNKAKTVKVTWRKVANAKKYEVKVGNKTYTAKKATLTVKKLKKGKTYKIKVRAKATGFKTGAWSKTVKVKIKK